MVSVLSSTAIAFLGGFLSFLSPCVLPLVPAYLGFLTSTSAGSSEVPTRAALLRHASAFVVGFTATFLILWLALAVVGYAVGGFIYDLRPLAGLGLVVLGLHLAGLISLRFLYRTVQLPMAVPQWTGSTRSLATGMLFAAGWTPCVGPVLAAVLVLAASVDTMTRGTLLLLAYCAGLGVPFILTALVLSKPVGVFVWARRHAAAVQTASGALVTLLGLLILTGSLSRLSRFVWFPIELPG